MSNWLIKRASEYDGLGGGYNPKIKCSILLKVHLTIRLSSASILSLFTASNTLAVIFDFI